MEEFIRSFGVSTPLLTIPWLVQEKLQSSNVQSVQHPLKVVIPGTLKYSGRDWAPVFQILESYPDPLQITFLGPSNSKVGLALKNKLQVYGARHKLVFFDSPVSLDPYSANCKDADIFILPYQDSIEHASIREKGGISKVCGGEHDPVRYGKLSFIGEAYRSNPFFSAYQIKYENGDRLQQLLVNLKSENSILENDQTLSVEFQAARWKIFLAYN